MVSSRYIFKFLRESLCVLIPEDSIYQQYYYRFEYLHSLCLSHFLQKEYTGPFPVVIGDFLNVRSLSAYFDCELDKYKERWPFLTGNLFDSSLERLKETKRGFDESIVHARRQLRMWP